MKLANIFLVSLTFLQPGPLTTAIGVALYFDALHFTVRNALATRRLSVVDLNLTGS